MAASNAERRETEIALLEAMYPEIVTWHTSRAEISYRTDDSSLLLRLPDEYPAESRPIVLSASFDTKKDSRDDLTYTIDQLSVPAGQECLDAIIQAFEELRNGEEIKETPSDENIGQETAPRYRTCIIWLHHLLNTNKRKLAITPATGSTGIAGCTKPGYPGVLIYSGKASIVDPHVAILRDQRWQAFQIRHDEESSRPWSFTSLSIVEVSSMAEVVDCISDPEQKQVFLKAIGIK